MSRKKKLYEARHLNRRQFLIGSGATFLVLPPLLSLMPETVAAQVVSNTRRRAITWYGICGLDGPHLFPSNQPDLTQQPGTHVYSKPLANFSGQISRLIDSDFVSMYPHMNLLQGLSMTGGLYQGHNISVLAGVHWGDRDPRIGRTIDAIMENSTGVYKSGEVIANKAIRLITGAADDEFNYYMDANGNRRTSNSIQGDKNLFNTLFKNFTSSGTGTTGAGDDKLIVDRVYADLKKLESNTRISKEDKIVLDRYISSVYDLQLKVNANSGPACTKPTISYQAVTDGNYYYLPENGWGITDCGAMYDNYIQMIKLAFACDLTRVVNVGCTLWTNQPINKDSNGGLHHEAGGSAIQADRQKWHLKKFLKLAKELSATPDPYGGGSILDNSIMLWTNELGDWTTGHNTLSMPAVTFGSCGGYFKTGYFMDYRQRPFTTVDGSDYYLGRPFKQLLQSMMTAMGVPKSEYMKYGDGKGFGEFKEGIDQFDHVIPKAFTPYAAEHNDPLPFVSKVA